MIDIKEVLNQSQQEILDLKICLVLFLFYMKFTKLKTLRVNEK